MKLVFSDIIITSSLLILIITIIILYRKNTLLETQNKNLTFQEALYRGVFEQSPIGIALLNYDKDTKKSSFINSNPIIKEIFNRNTSDLKNINWRELSNPKDLEKELKEFTFFHETDLDSYSLEKQIIRPDNSKIFVNIKVSKFHQDLLSDSLSLCLIEDITERRKSEEALKESERSKSVFLSQLPGMAYRCKYDKDWTMEFVSEGCKELTGYKPQDLINNQSISFNSIISEKYRDIVWDRWTNAIKQNRDYRSEYEIITKSKEIKWVFEIGQASYDDKGKLDFLEGIILDITESKKKEQRILYLSEHDFLTGLYNQSYLEKNKKKINLPKHHPLSIVFCDIDGLRVINDAYGYSEGDYLITETAKLIKCCARKDDLIARLGGGEFVMVLPNTNSEQAYKLIERIKETINSYNRANKSSLYDINITLAYSTKESTDKSIDDTIKTAERYLRKRKLLNQNSSHSSIVSSIMATLYAKSQETEEHGQRLNHFSSLIGAKIGLEEKDLDDLKLLAKLHDIGKIGIDDSILNKPGKLSKEEWVIMKQHPEIGYRIARSTPQLKHIAKYILYHHERWDGKGYPRGLKGKNIPLISRILAITDAYDAMTEDRVYRKAMSKQAALKEIETYAGTQFDPDIAKLFIELLKD